MFTMYLQYQASEKCANKRPTILFYSLCTLYVLSVASFAMFTVFEVRILFMTMTTFFQAFSLSGLMLRCLGHPNPPLLSLQP